MSKMQNKNIARIALATVFILLVPLVAMQFTDEVNWNLADFLIAGLLLFGTGLMYELLARKMENATHRLFLGVVLLAVLFLVWADLAVGIFNIPGISGN